MSESTPQLNWDIGTAYDFFISLSVLHDPNRFGLRGSWAAGVRSRLPNPEREIIQDISDYWTWPLHWVHTLPAPKDCRTVLRHLTDMTPKERILRLGLNFYMAPAVRDILREVAERGSWDDNDVTAVRAYDQDDGKTPSKQKLQGTLEIFADAETYGEGLLSGLQEYYDAFFAEEEARIRPVMEHALADAQEMAATMALSELLEELSQGVRFTDPLDLEELILAPSFWATPLMIFVTLSDDGKKEMFLFGARPSDMSLVPGEQVPELLYQSLKALADPTRLRVLHYLADKPQTPAELARRLRLRSPTVVHHLHTLRLARLVHLSLGQDGKRYELRREAVASTCRMLDAFLNLGE